MSDKLIIALLLSFSTLGAVLSSSSLKDVFTNNNTDISLHISDDAVVFTADYPTERSPKVQAYLQAALQVEDMRSMEAKNYQLPGGLFAKRIQSKKGYFKINVDRQRSPAGAVDQVKLICEDIKKILAEK